MQSFLWGSPQKPLLCSSSRNRLVLDNDIYWLLQESAVLPAVHERKALPVHTDHLCDCPWSGLWWADNQWCHKCRKLTFGCSALFDFYFLISVNCVLLLECHSLIGCLSLVEVVCNKSGFSASWWLPRLLWPHKDAAWQSPVSFVVFCITYCHLNCPCFTTEAFSVCHHNHLTWSK